MMMRTIALMLMLAVCSASLGGCFVGKGKAPAPITSRG
jgi:predicted small secreted protein